MPAIVDAKKVGKEHDRRRKLTDEDREEIQNMHKSGVSIRAIAREYEGKCSRRLIQFVLFPERKLVSNYPGHWKKYYDTDKQREYMQSHRKYKKELLDKGLI